MTGFLIEIGATAIDVIFMVWFVVRFQGYLLRNKLYTWIWGGVFLIYQIFIDYFYHGFDLLPILGVFIIALGCALSVDFSKKTWAIFSAFLYVIVIMLSSSLVFATFSIVGVDVDVTLYGSNSYQRILYILLCKLVHFAFYRLLLYLFKRDRTLDWKNACLSFGFTLVTALGLSFLMKFAASNQNPAFDVTVMGLSVIMIFMNLILYVMIYEIQALLKKQYNLMLLQERMSFEKSRLEDAAVIWGNIRKAKHDLYNHFSVIEGKLNDNNVEGCKQYLSELHATVDKMATLIQSGNSVIDYLVNSKLSNLEGVELLVSGYVGNLGDISDVDLSCILGNILDNAVEAQSKVAVGKRIELHFAYQNSSRVIICKNTVHESVLKNNRDLKSTKKASDEHGLGHQIVEATVQKYGGLVDYFESGDMFGVQIVIPKAEQEN